MAIIDIKTVEKELANGDLQFTAQIAFKSESHTVKLNHNLPSFTMKEDAPMTEFAELMDNLKDDARQLAETTLASDMKEIQKGFNKKFRKDYGKDLKALPKFS